MKSHRLDLDNVIHTQSCGTFPCEGLNTSLLLCSRTVSQYLQLQRVCLLPPPFLISTLSLPLHCCPFLHYKFQHFPLNPPSFPFSLDVSPPQVFRRSVLKVVERKAKSIFVLGVALILMAFSYENLPEFERSLAL